MISGAVNYAGKYVLASKKSESDIVKRQAV
jgi:hypothetical protein